MSLSAAPAAAQRLLREARSRLGLSTDALRDLLVMPPRSRADDDHDRYQALATLADVILERRTYTTQTVNGFYSSARRGQPGEASFEGGLAALRMHRYPAAVIARLPQELTTRFLGIGNVWNEVQPRPQCRVVDVGCGAGVDLAVGAALSNDISLVGVDKRPDLLRVAATACPRASLVVGDVSAAPLARAAFDVVLANGLPPLQRPLSLATTAAILCSLVAPGGTVSATVIVASPGLTAHLTRGFPDEGAEFARGLATLMSGKPTDHDVAGAFARDGIEVRLHPGQNPYLSESTRQLTAMVQVTAVLR